MTPDGLLSVADVAAHRGWDRTTAWRYLLRLEREQGAKLVREGRAIRIDPEELRRVVASTPGRRERKIEGELAATRRRLDRVEYRQKKLETELRDFRKMAHDWFMKPRITVLP